jgi:hypothetical protein
MMATSIVSYFLTIEYRVGFILSRCCFDISAFPTNYWLTSGLVNNSFSEFDHDGNFGSQGGIPAGGDFRASENTTACPLTGRHNVKWLMGV